MEETSAHGRQARDVQPRWAPLSPIVAILPGTLLVFIGCWMTSPPIAGVCIAVGAAFLIMGAVAKGVVWGLELHLESRR